jgi:excisionase family DNA binding protein
MNEYSEILDEELLTGDELATRLKLKRAGVDALVRRNVIPALRVGRKIVRFSWLQVTSALAKRATC